MRIKNFAKFQHFKDRSPPWVKLYRDILDDPEWHELDPKSAKVLVMLWLIASDDETRTGELPESKKLCFRLRITEKELKQHVTALSHWLDHDDISTISTGYQHDAPERAGEETEGETETEKKPAPKTSARGSRFPSDSTLSEDWRKEAQSVRKDWANGTIDRVFESFRDYWSAKPGRDGLKLDWLATWRNWCRNDHTKHTETQKSGFSSSMPHMPGLLT